MAKRRTSAASNAIECSSTSDGCVKKVEVYEGQWVADTTDISIHVSFEAWENYKGSLCTYDKSTFSNDDDGYVSQSCIIYPEQYTPDTFHTVACTGSQAALMVDLMWYTTTPAPATPSPLTPFPVTSAPPIPVPSTYAPVTPSPSYTEDADSSSSVVYIVLAAVCAVVVVGAVVAGVMYKVRSQGGAADVPAQGAPLDEYAAHEDVPNAECMVVQ